MHTIYTIYTWNELRGAEWVSEWVSEYPIPRDTSEPAEKREEKEWWKDYQEEDSAKVSEIVNPESPIFKCDYCEATFKSEKSFKIHAKFS